MSELLQDLRYSLRSLRTRPGFAAAALLTLALGIGVNVLVFSLIDAVLLRPLPYRDPGRIVEVWNSWQSESHGQLAVPELHAYRDGSDAFAAIAGFARGSASLSEGGEPERVQAIYAGSDIFAVLGVEAVRGRLFSAADDHPGAEPVAVLSWELWQRRFGGREDLVGRRIRIDGTPTTLVGVLPPDVRMPSDYRSGSRTDVWAPLEPLLPAELANHWGMHFLSGLARLEGGVDLAGAQAEMGLIVERIRASGAAGENAVAKPGFAVRLLPALDEVVGPVRPALLVLLAAVGFVLLIACVNVANLQIVLGLSRRSELALRGALGASRGRLVRQMLTESLLLGALGGALGLALALLGQRALVLAAPPGIPRLDEVSLDPSVLAYAVSVSLVSGLVFGVLPALRASAANLIEALRGLGRDEGSRGGGGRRILVAAEVALAVVLVIGAGLLARTFWNLQRVDPGYRIDRILTLDLSLPESAYAEGAEVSSFFTRLQARLAALPGVEAAGAVSHLPLASRRGDWNFYPEDRVIAPGEPKPRGDWQIVTPGYFEAMGVHLLEGRLLGDGDDAEGLPVLLVNQPLAERYWPGSSPVGQRVRLGGNDDNPLATIVGVVAPVHHETLSREPVPELYIPHAQAAEIMGIGSPRELTFTVRTANDPRSALAAVRAEIAALDADLPVADVRTMREVRSRSLAVPRFALVALASFSLLALALGAIGIFGVISYLVGCRRREIGIRLALGARPRTISALVLAQGVRPAAAGIAAGLLAAAALTRALGSLLFGITPLDPLTFAAVAVLFLAIAATASYLPARRASSLDPTRILREG